MPVKKKVPASWRTAVKARLRLDTRVLTAHDFTDTVHLVTPDLTLLVTGATYGWVGPHFLLWTEHYGRFMVHRDEVIQWRAWPTDSTLQ